MFRRYVVYVMPRLACDRPLSYIYLRHLTQKVTGVMYYGISLWVREELIRQLQSVMNAAARLIYGHVSLRPHLQRTHHPPLAQGSGEGTV